MKMSEKYDIEEIKQMRLQGLTLKEIADYYGVHIDTIRKYLKRKYGVRFGDFDKVCKYCGKTFKPKNPNHKFCSITCAYFHRLEHWARNSRRYYRRLDTFRKKPYLDRSNPTIAYKEAIYLLNIKRDNAICELCGNTKDFEIMDGNVVCMKCGLCI